MMVDKGIMEEIREHLARGQSSQEVIALGYAPGSVYKVQRQLRHSSDDQEQAAARTAPEAQVSVVDTEAVAQMERLGTENAEVRTQMAELLQEVERVTSLHSQLDQLQRRLEGLDTKVGESQQEISRYAQEQQRIETLERQVQRLDEVVRLLSLLVYHLDVHHRQQIHGWPANPADRDLQPSDQGYRTLQQGLRTLLTETLIGAEQRQRFGLPLRFKNLAHL
jgi:predicted RNase H-like nuclease (RuvC/YqgF family)